MMHSSGQALPTPVKADLWLVAFCSGSEENACVSNKVVNCGRQENEDKHRSASVGVKRTGFNWRKTRFYPLKKIFMLFFAGLLLLLLLFFSSSVHRFLLDAVTSSGRWSPQIRPHYCCARERADNLRWEFGLATTAGLLAAACRGEPEGHQCLGTEVKLLPSWQPRTSVTLCATVSMDSRLSPQQQCTSRYPGWHDVTRGF